MTNTEIDLSADVIDVRDIIERVEKLDAELQQNYTLPADERKEFATLTAILEELQGNGGDEQWRGDWYPVTLIRESYFTDYCQELCEDIGDLPRDLPSYIEIDWEATARNLAVDYSEVDVDGVTYFYR